MSDSCPSSHVPCVTQDSTNSLKLKISFAGNKTSNSATGTVGTRFNESSTPQSTVPPIEVTSNNLFTVLSEVHEQLVRRDSKRIFANPVTDEIAAGYSQVISHPMDLGTILNRLRSRTYYASATDYMADVALMCDNAMIYNAPDTIYFQRACKLLLLCRKLLTFSSLRKLGPQLGLTCELDETEMGEFCLTGELPTHPYELQSVCCRRLMGQDNPNLRSATLRHTLSDSPAKPWTTVTHAPPQSLTPPIIPLTDVDATLARSSHRPKTPSPSTPPTPPLSKAMDIQEVTVDLELLPTITSVAESTPLITSYGENLVTTPSAPETPLPPRRPRGRPRKYPRPDAPAVTAAAAAATTTITSATTLTSPNLPTPMVTPIRSSRRASATHAVDSTSVSTLSFTESVTSSTQEHCTHGTDDETSLTESERSRTSSPTPPRKRRISQTPSSRSGSGELLDLSVLPTKRQRRHVQEAAYSLKLVVRKAHKFLKPDDTSPMKRSKPSKRDSEHVHHKAEKRRDSPVTHNASVVDEPVDNVILTQARQASATAAQLLRSKYANINETQPELSPRAIGPRVSYLNLDIPGQVTAVICPDAQSKWPTPLSGRSVTPNPEPTSNPIPVNYPPVLVHCLTGSRHPPAESDHLPEAKSLGAPGKVQPKPWVEPLNSEQQEVMKQLEKLKYNSDEPISAAIHGPLSLFSNADMVRLSDVYGSDLTNIEYAFSLLRFVEPMGRWARRWACKKLDALTDGLHSRLANFSQATVDSPSTDDDPTLIPSCPPVQSWPNFAGLTVDSPTPPCSPCATPDDLLDGGCSSFLDSLLSVDSTGLGVVTAQSGEKAIDPDERSVSQPSVTSPVVKQSTVNSNLTGSNVIPSPSPAVPEQSVSVTGVIGKTQSLHRNPLEVLIESSSDLPIPSDSVLKSVLHSPIRCPTAPINRGPAPSSVTSVTLSELSSNGGLIKSLPHPSSVVLNPDHETVGQQTASSVEPIKLAVATDSQVTSPLDHPPEVDQCDLAVSERSQQQACVDSPPRSSTLQSFGDIATSTATTDLCEQPCGTALHPDTAPVVSNTDPCSLIQSEVSLAIVPHSVALNEAKAVGDVSDPSSTQSETCDEEYWSQKTPMEVIASGTCSNNSVEMDMKPEGRLAPSSTPPYSDRPYSPVNVQSSACSLESDSAIQVMNRSSGEHPDVSDREPLSTEIDDIHPAKSETNPLSPQQPCDDCPLPQDDCIMITEPDSNTLSDNLDRKHPDSPETDIHLETNVGSTNPKFDGSPMISSGHSCRECSCSPGDCCSLKGAGVIAESVHVTSGGNQAALLDALHSSQLDGTTGSIPVKSELHLITHPGDIDVQSPFESVSQPQVDAGSTMLEGSPIPFVGHPSTALCPVSSAPDVQPEADPTVDASHVESGCTPVGVVESHVDRKVNSSHLESAKSPGTPHDLSCSEHSPSSVSHDEHQPKSEGGPLFLDDDPDCHDRPHSTKTDPQLSDLSHIHSESFFTNVREPACTEPLSSVVISAQLEIKSSVKSCLNTGLDGNCSDPPESTLAGIPLLLDDPANSNRMSSTHIAATAHDGLSNEPLTPIRKKHECQDAAESGQLNSDHACNKPDTHLQAVVTDDCNNMETVGVVETGNGDYDCQSLVRSSVREDRIMIPVAPADDILPDHQTYFSSHSEGDTQSESNAHGSVTLVCADVERASSPQNVASVLTTPATPPPAAIANQQIPPDSEASVDENLAPAISTADAPTSHAHSDPLRAVSEPSFISLPNPHESSSLFDDQSVSTPHQPVASATCPTFDHQESVPTEELPHSLAPDLCSDPVALIHPQKDVVGISFDVSPLDCSLPDPAARSSVVDTHHSDVVEHETVFGHSEELRECDNTSRDDCDPHIGSLDR